MLNFIFKFFKVSFLTISISFITLFSFSIPIFADQLNNNATLNNTTDIVEDSVNATENRTVSSAPDLGDEQTFPFIPGFGKNSGKD